MGDPWYYTPPLYFDTGAPRMIRWELRDAAMRQLEKPKLLRFVPENPDDRFDWDSRLLDLKPDFVVFSSFETEGLDRLRTAKGKTPEQDLLTGRFVSFYERLKNEYPLDRTFGGTANRFGAGPTRSASSGSGTSAGLRGSGSCAVTASAPPRTRFRKSTDETRG